MISVFLYACESWTLDAYLEQRIAAFQMRCLRRLLGIDYRDHVTNVSVREKVTAEIGRHQELLEIVKSRKLHYKKKLPCQRVPSGHCTWWSRQRSTKKEVG